MQYMVEIQAMRRKPILLMDVMLQDTEATYLTDAIQAMMVWQK